MYSNCIQCNPSESKNLKRCRHGVDLRRNCLECGDDFGLPAVLNVPPMPGDVVAPAIEEQKQIGIDRTPGEIKRLPSWMRQWGGVDIYDPAGGIRCEVVGAPLRGAYYVYTDTNAAGELAFMIITDPTIAAHLATQDGVGRHTGRAVALPGSQHGVIVGEGGEGSTRGQKVLPSGKRGR